MKPFLANGAWFLELFLKELHEGKSWTIAKIASDGLLTSIQMAGMRSR